MKQNKFLAVSMAAALSLTLAGCSGKTSGSDSTFFEKSIQAEQLNNIEKDNSEKDKYLVIDVRDENSYKEGHLKYAINIPTDKIDKSIEQIRLWREKPVVVYSDDDNKTKEAIDKLTKQGFKDVSGAKSVKEYSYDLVKYNVLTGAQFQDAVFDKEAGNTFIDARDEKDYVETPEKVAGTKEAIHAAGAKNVDVNNLDNIQSILPESKQAPIYVYDYNGERAATVAQKLVDLGYTNVSIANDGTNEFDYKFGVAECCVDDGEQGDSHNHDNMDHSNMSAEEHAKHMASANSSEKKDDHSNHDHSGHNH